MIRSILCALLGSALLAAQNDVCVTGVVRVAGGPSICNQSFTHALEDTSVRLLSRTLDLNRYVGRNVRVVGRNVGVTCPILDVTAVNDPPPAALESCGLPMLGCPIKLKLCPIGLGQGWLLFGLGPDFVPIGCSSTGFLDGSLLLANPMLIQVFGSGICLELVLTVPQSSALLGLDIWFQGARRDIGPVGPLEMSNLVRLRITPFLPPCAPLNC